MNENLKGFFKRRLSVALWPIVNLTMGLVLLPLVLHRESIEIQTQIVGHLTGIRVRNGDSADQTSFEFTVNEEPSTFAVSNMSLGNKFQFSQLAPGSEIRFRVETERLENHESKIPVLEMTSGSEEIVEPDSVAEFQFRKRMFLGGICLILFFVGSRQALRVRKLYLLESKRGTSGSYDPILLLIARNPLEAGAIFGAILLLFWLILVPFRFAHFGLVLIAGGYGIFVARYRGRGHEIAWIKDALSIEAERLAKNPARTITFAPKHIKAVEKLLKAKVDINQVRDAAGKSPLHIAAEGGHTEAVDLLIRVGALVDVVDNLGETPLMLAAKKGAMGVAIKLLEQKPDLLLVNNEGQNAAQIAEKAKKNKQLIEVLTKSTAEADAARKKKAAAPASENLGEAPTPETPEKESEKPEKEEEEEA